MVRVSCNIWRETDERGEDFNDMHALVFELLSKGDAQGVNGGFRSAVARHGSHGHDSEERRDRNQKSRATLLLTRT